jgi:2-methylcitrate dehydratase PrpD
MSIQYGVAAALVHRRLGEANYRSIDDPEVLRVIDVSELRADAEFSAQFPATQGAEVEVALADGRRLRTTLHDVIPATEAEIRRRFHEAAIPVVGQRRSDAIEDFVESMEKHQDAGRLAVLCALTAKQARTPVQIPSAEIA